MDIRDDKQGYAVVKLNADYLPKKTKIIFSSKEAISHYDRRAFLFN